MKITAIGFVGLICACTAHASLTISNASYLGINQTVSIPGSLAGTSNGYNLGYAAGGGGGEFLGSVSNSTAGTDSTVGFWCVDDQLYFNPTGSANSQNTGLADIVALNQINSSTASQVRYSGVTNGGTPGWTNTTANGSPLPTSAVARYEMAAYLIQMYENFPTSIGPSATSNSATNPAEQDAIQNAIWAITNNSSSVQQTAGASSISSNTTNVTSTGYWVAQALANYSAVNAGGFAVVSWGASSTGALNTGYYTSSSPALQTFLVQLSGPAITTSVPTPEPGLYAIMAVGLVGLFLGLPRRKRV